MIVATLGDLEFVGDAGEATYTIRRNGLQGWFDGVETRNERTERPSDDGEFDIPGFLTGRLVTIEGMIQTSSDAAFEEAIEALAAVSATSKATLSVETSRGTTTASVRRYGKPDVQVLVYGRTANYALTLLAPDPRRYGVNHPWTDGDYTVSGIEHDGNFPATPNLIIEGDRDAGYTVVGPDSKTITVVEPLNPGVPHVINFTTGGLYVDDVRVPGGMSVYEPWTVPPGASLSASVTVGLVLTVMVKDTWA